MTFTRNAQKAHSLRLLEVNKHEDWLGQLPVPSDIPVGITIVHLSLAIILLRVIFSYIFINLLCKNRIAVHFETV